MNIPPALLRYVNPHPVPSSTAKRIYLTSSTYDYPAGTITNVNRVILNAEDAMVYMVEDHDDNFLGIEMNPTLLNGAPVIGLLDDGTPIYGYAESASENSLSVSDARRFDGLGMGVTGPVLAVNHWMVGATWAGECWPEERDSDSTIARKMDLAEAHHNESHTRYIMVWTALSQGELDACATVTGFPESLWGAWVSVQIFIPNQLPANRSDFPIFNGVQHEFPDVRFIERQYASTWISFQLPHHAGVIDQVGIFSRNNVARAVRNKLGNEIIVGQFNTTPVLLSVK